MRQKTKNSVSIAYDCILENIIQRNLKPGEIVTENSLAEKYELGRTPIREALKRLEMEGLIETENRTKKIYYLSPEDLEDIFELKIVIESAVAAWAAKSTNIVLRERLSATIDEMQALTKGHDITKNPDNAIRKWLILDVQFHEIITEMAGNRKVMPIVKNLNIQWHRLKIGITAIEGRMEKAIQEHCIIGNAILNNNENLASQKMGKHIASLRDMIVTMMRAFG